MKKRNYIRTALLSLVAMSLFSSCLKDTPTTVDFSKGATFAELTLSGLSHFNADAITADTAVISFGVNIASPKTPTSASSVTLDVDPKYLASYLTAHATDAAPIAYEIMPSSAYTFTTTVVDIPSGERVKIVTFTVYKNTLDPAKSYMLPIAITKATGANVSANDNVHYYHVIGNDFAGAYLHDFTRTPAGGNFVGKPVILSPVTPTQFETTGGYFTADVRYEVSFTKTGSGAGTLYSKFKISINADDIKYLSDNGIAITTPPSLKGYDPNVKDSFTYAEAVALFTFQYDVLGGSGARHNEDRYYKP